MKNLIELNNIEKSYSVANGKFKALNNINLTVEKGEFLAITGPSGSGKTTLMNILGFLDYPDCGTYTFNSNIYNSYKDKDLSKIRNEKIGYIFQSFNLLSSLTALQNVELPLIYQGIPKLKRKEIAENALKTVGLYNRLNHKPSQLSGGQKQRVAIARAIATDPLLILADEPTGSLDDTSGNEITEHLIKLNNLGSTVILITHNQKTAALAMRRIEILDGRLVF